MSNAQPEKVDPRIFRIARHRLGGADFSWITDRTGVEVPIVEEAWEHCRLLLTQHLSGINDPPLTDKDIFNRCDECLRLLLHWQESLEASVKIDALMVNKESTTQED